MSSYPAPPHPAAYARASAALERLVGTLGTAEVRSIDHAAAERLIMQDGTEVLWLLFEDWLGCRVQSQSRRDVVGSDDVPRTHHRPAATPMATGSAMS